MRVATMIVHYVVFRIEIVVEIMTSFMNNLSHHTKLSRSLS